MGNGDNGLELGMGVVIGVLVVGGVYCNCLGKVMLYVSGCVVMVWMWLNCDDMLMVENWLVVGMCVVELVYCIKKSVNCGLC